MKPKCVNCGKPGGTTFASVFNKEGEKSATHCGNCKEEDMIDVNVYKMYKVIWKFIYIKL